jgi:hypothetical protein
MATDGKYTDYFVDKTEPLLSVDKYYKPLVAKDENYATLLLVRLILLEPGTFQTHPDCGVGLVSKFRYATDVDMVELQKRIKDQIMLYLPQYSLVNVKCELGDNKTGDEKVIKIYITSEQLNVFLPINVETGEVLETTKLSDFR